MTNPANAASRETREIVARIIAPQQWEAREGWLEILANPKVKEMREHWKNRPGQAVTDSLATADAILAALHDTAPTDQAQRGGEVERMREALDAAHYYIDASDSELSEAGLTRTDALRNARDLRAALAQSGEPS